MAPEDEFCFHARSLDDTNHLARSLGNVAAANLVVALLGTLGAGKTAFVRAFGVGMGLADARLVSSPTFVLVHEYQARLPIYHFDSYRLKTVAEFEDLGVDEYFRSGGVCLVEWADRVREVLPAEHIEVRIETIEGTERLFHCRLMGGDRFSALFKKWKASAKGAHADSLLPQ